MIRASAPVRICDNGGWTDTWFGGPGRVVNLAVTPGVEVTIGVAPGPEPVVLDLEAFGDRYPIVPGSERVSRHPLVEAAVDACPPPGDLSVEVFVRSGVPAGCGAGTSAAVAVALLGALAATRGEQLSRDEVAYAAHQLEADVLGIESGIQDQLSAAYGGINYIEIESYPRATVQPLPVWDALSHQLSLVFLGQAHESSAVHRQVIGSLGPRTSSAFSRLRDAAAAARDAVIAQDLYAFGRSMVANTEAQKSLHPDVVGADARRVIEGAASGGALGWKVNGAGGQGGSVTVLSATRGRKVAFEERLDAQYRPIPIEISPVGLQVAGSL